MSLKAQFEVAVVNEISSNTSVTVSASATSSSVLTCGGTSPTGIFLPSTFVTSNITFKVCKTPDGSFLPVRNFDGTAFTVAGAASTFVPLLPSMFNSVLYIQLSFDQTQTSAEVIDFALCPIFQGLHG